MKVQVSVIKSFIGALKIDMSSSGVMDDSVELGKLTYLDGREITPAGPLLNILTKVKSFKVIGASIPPMSVVSYPSKESTHSGINILNGGDDGILVWTDTTGFGKHLGHITIKDGVPEFITSSILLARQAYPDINLGAICTHDWENSSWVNSDGKHVSELYLGALRACSSINDIEELILEGDALTFNLKGGDIVEVNRIGGEIFSGYVKCCTHGGFLSTTLLDGEFIITCEPIG